MHPLVMLYKLQARALVRRTTRNLRSAKGAFLFVFGIAVVGLWLAPSIWQAYAAPRTDPAVVVDAAPLVLLTMCLLTLITSGGEKAVAFTPAEVDFLFPGPFTRRQLLAYKLGKALAGIAFSSALLSVVMLRHAAGWPQAFAAMFLAMLFLQLFGMAVTLVAQAAGQRAYTLTRKIVLGAVIVAVAVAVLPALSAGDRPGFMEVARMLRASRAGAVLLAPLEVFGRLFVAEWWPHGVLYALLAVAIDGALVALVFYLDADYLEAAAANSQAVYERLQRVRKGGLSAIATPGKTARGHLPRFPHLRGAGPIAWRQATSALRNARGLLFVMLILAIAVGPLLISAGQGKDLGGPVVAAMAWITLIVGAWLRFDFRGDLDQIDHLKSMPASALAISAGQLVTPTLMMTACHLMIVISVTAVTRRAEPVLMAAAALCLPFNLLLFAVENGIFLTFPTRAAANPADFQGYGRQILVLFVKAVILVAAGGIAALLGLLAHTLTGGAWPATIATAALALAVVALAMIPVVAWTFTRFDVTADLPA